MADKKSHMQMQREILWAHKELEFLKTTDGDFRADAGFCTGTGDTFEHAIEDLYKQVFSTEAKSVDNDAAELAEYRRLKAKYERLG